MLAYSVCVLFCPGNRSVKFVGLLVYRYRCLPDHKQGLVRAVVIQDVPSDSALWNAAKSVDLSLALTCPLRAERECLWRLRVFTNRTPVPASLEYSDTYEFLPFLLSLQVRVLIQS